MKYEEAEGLYDRTEGQYDRETPPDLPNGEEI
jgi:hypothetical protein